MSKRMEAAIKKAVVFFRDKLPIQGVPSYPEIMDDQFYEDLKTTAYNMKVNDHLQAFVRGVSYTAATNKDKEDIATRVIAAYYANPQAVSPEKNSKLIIDLMLDLANREFNEAKTTVSSGNFVKSYNGLTEKVDYAITWACLRNQTGVEVTVEGGGETKTYKAI